MANFFFFFFFKALIKYRQGGQWVISHQGVYLIETAGDHNLFLFGFLGVGFSILWRAIQIYWSLW